MIFCVNNSLCDLTRRKMQILYKFPSQFHMKMQIQYISIIALLVIVLFVPQTTFGSDEKNSTLENQFGTSTKTELMHDGSILILNQSADKQVYSIGENMSFTTELINVGNKSANIVYWEPISYLEIKNQSGDVIWPTNPSVVYIPEFREVKTLKPGEQFSTRPWEPSINYAPNPVKIALLSPGNYTVISVATLTFDTNTVKVTSLEPLWSKPMQITVLPEKMPEFPLALPILLIGITSLILFCRIKFETSI